MGIVSGVGRLVKYCRPSLALLRSREGLLSFLLLLCVVAMRSLSDRFLSAQNLFEMTRSFVEIGLLSIPMTLIIITAGIDLSVGSMLGFCAVVLGVAWSAWHLPIYGAIVVCLAAGAAAGAFQGFLVARFGIPPLIVTLAGLAIFRGLAMGISQARPVGGFPESFYVLGQYYIAGFVPTQLSIFIALLVAYGVLLAKTTLGRSIYAVGANEIAARFSGIAVERVKFLLYTASGWFAGLAAAIYVSRVSTAKADAGIGYELDVITAVVLGGASISGGVGSMWGSVLGLLIISVLRNGLTLARFPSESQTVLIGAVLIAAVYLDRVLRRNG